MKLLPSHTLGPQWKAVFASQIAFLTIGFFIASSVPFTRTFSYLLMLFSTLLLCGTIVGIAEDIIFRSVNLLTLSIVAAFGIFSLTVYNTSVLYLLLYDYRPVQALFLVICIIESVFAGWLVYLIGRVREKRVSLLLKIAGLASPVLIAALYWVDTNFLVGIYQGVHLFLRIQAYLLIDLFVLIVLPIVGIKRYPVKGILATATVPLVVIALFLLLPQVERLVWPPTRIEKLALLSAKAEKPISPPSKIRNASSWRAKAGKSKRVFIILLDALRADHLSCYGYSRETSPNIDAVAKEATIFRYCVAAGAKSSRSVPTLFTSCPFHHLWKGHSPKRKGNFIQDDPSIASVMKQNGFYTLLVASGLPGCGDGGFECQATCSDFSKLERIKERASKLDRSFCYLHYFEIHGSFDSKYLRNWMDEPGFKEYGVKEFSYGTGRINTYDTVIKFEDMLIGQLIDFLKSEDLYDDSIIIITADHGAVLGEHRYFGYGRQSYNGQLLVPLIIKAPGCKHRFIQETVGLIDIFPTILDLMGIEWPDTIEGRSLAPFLFEKDYRGEAQRVYFSDTNPTIIKGEYKLLGNNQLYLFKSDPLEEKNLYKDLPQIVADLEKEREETNRWCCP